MSNQGAASNVAGWISDPSEHLIGSKLVCFLSHDLSVTTMRDGTLETVDFHEGVFQKRTVVRCSDEAHGTTVTWQPSEEFFTHTQVELDKVKELFHVISCLCPGLTIILQIDKNEPIRYYSKNGLSDLVTEALQDKELLTHRFEYNFVEGKNKMDFILTYTTSYSSTIVPYVNTGLTEKGPHISQIKAVITREFNKFFKEKKWLKASEENLSGDDIQEGLYVVFNLTAPSVAYDAQVKSTVTKIDMAPFTKALTEELQVWLNANEKEVKKIADKALAARKAREAAKRARDNVRNKSEKKTKLLNLPTKLVDAWSKDRNKCELLISEGK